MIEKTLKLFKIGDSQVIRLPKEFRFRDSEVIAKKIGGVVCLIPKRFRKGKFLEPLPASWAAISGFDPNTTRPLRIDSGYTASYDSCIYCLYIWSSHA